MFPVAETAYEVVIGLETHVELSTKTKLFCDCSTAFGGDPNSQICPVCLGLPGTLPVLNRRAVEYGVRLGIATHCTVHKISRFDRKNYYYPDLPKAYQISQLYAPLCISGFLSYPTKGGERVAGIREIHLEEDAGKLLHGETLDGTRADYNRCGVPLLEIVSEPDFHSAEEVVSYLETLRRLLLYLKISDGKMQEGSLRADVNLSVRPVGCKTLGVRTELKNMNSFRAIARAIEVESLRQIALLRQGDSVVQETRRWDEKTEQTLPMRSKEDARDYRYFPDPDLPPLVLSSAWIQEIAAELPELPEAKTKRFLEEYGLTSYEREQILALPALADFFEKTVSVCGDAKEAAHWILGDWIRMLRENGLAPGEEKGSPEALGKLIILTERNIINRTTAKQVAERIFRDNVDPEEYVRRQGLLLIQDDALVQSAVEVVLQECAQSVLDVRAGKEKAFGFLVGQTMRRLGGKGDPQMVNRLLREKVYGSGERAEF